MSKTETTICTLERGQLPAEAVRTSDLRKILQDTNSTNRETEFETMKRLIQTSDECDHSGIHYRVVFRTDRSISLHSLGFWGPHKTQMAEYDVSIIISRLTSLILAKQKRTTLSKFRKIVPARRREIFIIQLDQPVHVPAGSWTQIEFELNGPPTFRSEGMQFDCQGQGGVSFNFSDSSLQMPLIKYTVL